MSIMNIMPTLGLFDVCKQLPYKNVDTFGKSTQSFSLNCVKIFHCLDLLFLSNPISGLICQNQDFGGDHVKTF